MEKINIKNINKIDLSLKWWFSINLSKDTFWPYEYKFGRTDCYYNDKLQDRWTVLFPYKNKKFDNTEIFLETDDIIVCTWDRTNLSWEEKTFIDVINLKTEKKQRLYIEEVNLIYNGEKEIVVNGKMNWVCKTIKLDIESLEVKEEKEEKLLAFFKIIYNENEKKWYKLDLDWLNYIKIFIIKDNFYPINFERELYKLGISSYHNWEIETLDLWKLSSEKIVIDNKNFINNQNYIIDNIKKKKIISILYFSTWEIKQKSDFIFFIFFVILCYFSLFVPILMIWLLPLLYILFWQILSEIFWVLLLIFLIIISYKSPLFLLKNYSVIYNSYSKYKSMLIKNFTYIFFNLRWYNIFLKYPLKNDLVYFDEKSIKKNFYINKK